MTCGDEDGDENGDGDYVTGDGMGMGMYLSGDGWDGFKRCVVDGDVAKSHYRAAL